MENTGGSYIDKNQLIVDNNNSYTIDSGTIDFSSLSNGTNCYPNKIGAWGEKEHFEYDIGFYKEKYHPPNTIKEKFKTRKNIYTDLDNNFYIDVEVTGYEKDQLKVVTQGNTIIVEFFKDRNLEFVDDDEKVIFQITEIEIIDKKFEYDIPDIYDSSNLIAKKYENGFLRLKFPPRKKVYHQF